MEETIERLVLSLKQQEFKSNEDVIIFFTNSLIEAYRDGQVRGMVEAKLNN